MAWLIRRRSTIKGRIERLEKTLAQIPEEIANLLRELAALDIVIPLHEVAVDPVAIVGRRPRKPNMLPWGNMTRHILNYLRAADGPLYTDDIALHVAKLEKLDLDNFSRRKLIRRISSRLKTLTSDGIVKRHHPEQTFKIGRWSLRVPSDD